MGRRAELKRCFVGWGVLVRKVSLDQLRHSFQIIHHRERVLAHLFVKYWMVFLYHHFPLIQATVSQGHYPVAAADAALLFGYSFQKTSEGGDYSDSTTLSTFKNAVMRKSLSLMSDKSTFPARLFLGLDVISAMRLSPPETAPPTMLQLLARIECFTRGLRLACYHLGLQQGAGLSLATLNVVVKEYQSQERESYEGKERVKVLWDAIERVSRVTRGMWGHGVLDVAHAIEDAPRVPALVSKADTRGLRMWNSRNQALPSPPPLTEGEEGNSFLALLEW